MVYRVDRERRDDGGECYIITDRKGLRVACVDGPFSEEMDRTVHVFACAKDVLGELRTRYAQTVCGCKHPACRRCLDDLETEGVLNVVDSVWINSQEF